ncbi:MAG: hypothetical protein J5819_06185 [Eubacterium sp.]|nr:hypothetical protein [Eubacterium sp.]
MKIIQTVLAAFSEVLAEGAVMIPNLMFVGLYYQHYGEFDFILPFVLLYAFEKAGTFLLSGFGRVINPYAVWLIGNITAIIGCGMLLFGTGDNYFWDAGAILTGLGLSCFSPMYRATRDALKSEKAWLFTVSLYVGYLLLGGYLIFVMQLRSINMVTVISAVLGLVVISTVQCLLLWKRNPYSGNRIHERKTIRWDQFAYAAVVLLFTFAVRFYKQTATLWMIIWVGVGMALLILLTVCIKHEKYRMHSLRTLWYGAERNFVTIYSLIFFMAIGKYDLVMVSYLMIGIGVVVAKLVAPVFGKLCLAIAGGGIEKRNSDLSGSGYEQNVSSSGESESKSVVPGIYEPICIIAANAASCLMLLPWTACYMVGVAVTVVFVSMGSSSSIKAYLQDERFIVTERRLVRARFYGLGAVIEQAFMMIAMFIFSLVILGDGTDAISSYALREGDAANNPVFFFTLIACIVFNTVWGLVYCRKRV